MGTAWREHYERLARSFKCRQSCTGHHKKRGALRRLAIPYLRLSRFQGSAPYKEERTLPGTPADDIRDRLRYRTVPQLLHYDTISASRFRNINPIPFRPKSGINLTSIKSLLSERHLPIA